MTPEIGFLTTTSLNNFSGHTSDTEHWFGIGRQNKRLFFTRMLHPPLLFFCFGLGFMASICLMRSHLFPTRTSGTLAESLTRSIWSCMSGRSRGHSSCTEHRLFHPHRFASSVGEIASSIVGSYFSKKIPWTNCTVSDDLPTPPEPSTTSVRGSLK
ncbi:hypothetical protein Pelo_4117 [Pelomyxa schiedti]|nr:hypothetical protein Pelo_4117 [Pelomyxa schiedti]